MIGQSTSTTKIANRKLITHVLLLMVAKKTPSPRPDAGRKRRLGSHGLKKSSRILGTSASGCGMG